ncbi:MAG: hypothetical protein ACFCVG_14275 [Kineosporiaceae bacterium]
MAYADLSRGPPRWAVDTVATLGTFEDGSPTRLEAIPLALDFCRTRLAEPAEAAWVTDRFRRACSALGARVTDRDGVLVVEWEARRTN